MSNSLILFPSLSPMRLSEQLTEWWCAVHILRPETLLGIVDAASDAKRRGWLDRMRGYGRRLVMFTVRLASIAAKIAVEI
jgi:hypothetical protein